MAIYHLEAKVISRGTGRSAVAASAYMSCSEMLNDYDGIRHDYTRKQGLVWQSIFLPTFAPAEWNNREILWNAVEENEKTKDSRLAREFVVALPVELNKEDWISVLTEYVKRNFVDDGMCADVCIHDTDGHNPHAHIMLTVRPLNENGTWQHKTEKEYLCVKNGEERGFTSSEFKAEQNEGWEKQYQYQAGKKKIYLSPSQAEIYGYERLSKYPKSTKYGRQNPISQRWNSEEQLIAWRSDWADTINRFFDNKSISERIDHRSHKERGITEQPTIHEGVIARAMEKKGIKSERCKLNRQIKADNKLLRELRKQLEKLMNAVKETISSSAQTLESIRRNMLIIRYHFLDAKSAEKRFGNILSALMKEYKRYTSVSKKLKEARAERKKLLEDKKKTPAVQIFLHRDLSKRIADLSETIEELKTEKLVLINRFGISGDKEMKEVTERIKTLELSVAKTKEVQQKYSLVFDNSFERYKELNNRISGTDTETLQIERQSLRKIEETEARKQLSERFGSRYDSEIFKRAVSDVNLMLNDDVSSPEKSSVVDRLQNQQEQRNEQTHNKDRNQER